VAKNPLREVWAEGRTAFGLWAAIPSAFSAELVAGAGVDYVCVDQQHGVVDYASMVPMLQAIGAAGAAPITRVLSNDPFRIMKALDAGAWGVIVPLVNDAEEAARAVSACRYPPDGIRSYGPIRASSLLGSKDPEDLAGEVLCLVMVETREGLENVEEIAATPGVDGIYIGPLIWPCRSGYRPPRRLLRRSTSRPCAGSERPAKSTASLPGSIGPPGSGGRGRPGRGSTW
jgi:4-hydroxy-2-oxoheptanedioate aldolase